MRAKKKRYNFIDIFFLGTAAVFLSMTLLRVYGTERLDAIRMGAVSIVTGDLSLQNVVRAFGTWDELDEPVAAVFHAVDYKDQTVLKEMPYTEYGFEKDILSGRTQIFPDTVDAMVYMIELPCKTPVYGIVTSGFGTRTDPISGEEGFHYGIDIAAEEGTPIYTVSPGFVRESGYNSYGNYVVIEHDNGLQSLYAHCSTVHVEEGQTVDSGDLIGTVGMTGRATGNHLHFELWRAGYILDPTNYLEL